ncbi:MAG: hypothetical protein IJ783_02600, partial [Kiritimatiellae bacterium]|nr:hypothetical protein [Kiritimatiellia bacterium]
LPGTAYRPGENPGAEGAGFAAVVRLSDCTWGDAPPPGTALLAHAALAAYSKSEHTADEIGEGSGER